MPKVGLEFYLGDKKKIEFQLSYFGRLNVVLPLRVILVEKPIAQKRCFSFLGYQSPIKMSQKNCPK